MSSSPLLGPNDSGAGIGPSRPVSPALSETSAISLEAVPMLNLGPSAGEAPENSDTSSSDGSLSIYGTPRNADLTTPLLGREVRARQTNPFGGNRLIRWFNQWRRMPWGLSTAEKKRYYETIRLATDVNKERDIQIVLLSIKAMKLLRKGYYADYNGVMATLQGKIRDRVHERSGYLARMKDAETPPLFEVKAFYKLVTQAATIVDDAVIEVSTVQTSTVDHTVHQVFMNGLDLRGNIPVAGLQTVINPLGSDSRTSEMAIVAPLEEALLPHMQRQIDQEILMAALKVKSKLENSELGRRAYDALAIKQAIESAIDRIINTLTLAHLADREDIQNQLVNYLLDSILPRMAQAANRDLRIEELRAEIERLKVEKEVHTVLAMKYEVQRDIYVGYQDALALYSTALGKHSRMLSQNADLRSQLQTAVQREGALGKAIFDLHADQAREENAQVEIIRCLNEPVFALTQAGQRLIPELSVRDRNLDQMVENASAYVTRGMANLEEVRRQNELLAASKARSDELEVREQHAQEELRKTRVEIRRLKAELAENAYNLEGTERDVLGTYGRLRVYREDDSDIQVRGKQQVRIATREAQERLLDVHEIHVEEERLRPEQALNFPGVPGLEGDLSDLGAIDRAIENQGTMANTIREGLSAVERGLEQTHGQIRFIRTDILEKVENLLPFKERQREAIATKYERLSQIVKGHLSEGAQEARRQGRSPRDVPALPADREQRSDTEEDDEKAWEGQ